MGDNYLTRQQARDFYDGFGARQDAQGFYEDAALEVLLRMGDFGAARSVLEIGCGTGRLAEQLLGGVLPGDARYAGCDVSGVMIGLARARLARFEPRVTLWQSDAAPDFTPTVFHISPPLDRGVTSYVLDLLPEAGIAAMLSAAGAALRPGGLFCSVSLTDGPGLLSGLTSRIWRAVAWARPQLVGGCRPIALRGYLDPEMWTIRHRAVVTPWSIASEIVIAERR